MRVLSIDPGRKNLGLCVLDIDVATRTGVNDTVTFWRVCETPTDIAGVIEVLDSALQGVEFDETVIERQPPKNSTMKRFEHIFEMYFAMQRKPVYVIDSRHKLTFATKTPFWTGSTVEPGKGSWNYIKRKKISVSTVAKFLDATVDRHQSYHDLFAKSQKKDDLSDSLLQAQAFAHVVKHIDADNALVEKIIKPRPFPKPRAPRPGDKLTKANIVFVLQDCETPEDIQKTLGEKTKIRNAFITHFGSPDVFLTSRVRYLDRVKKKKEKPLPVVPHANITDDDREIAENHLPGVREGCQGAVVGETRMETSP
jgi:hypothetical protein